MQNVIPKWTSGLFVPNGRSIGGIAANVTISEQERDELTITEHPVEQGAPISDHAYKRPAEVTIRAGWSMQLAGDLSANGNGVYALLLSWQAALNPFDLYTGKRVYKNMLIQTLTVTTDNHSEYVLMADIVCRQVMIVKTKETKAAINSNPQNQADPGSNATPQEKGTQQPRDAGTGDDKGGGDYGGGPDRVPSGAGMAIDLDTEKSFAGTPEDPAVAPLPPATPEGTQVEHVVQNNNTPEKMDAKDSLAGARERFGADDPTQAPKSWAWF